MKPKTNKKQILKEKMDDKQIDYPIKSFIDGKFAEQDERIDRKFVEQDARIDKKFAEQDERIDRKFEAQKYWIEEMLMQLRSDFFTKIDPFLKEIEDAREHRMIETHEVEEIKSQMDNHEKRITKMENI